MTDFDDFDLDLKKVSSTSNGNAPDSVPTPPTSTWPCWLSTVTISLSVNHCESMGTPTTGMTKGCCKKGGNPDGIAKCV